MTFVLANSSYHFSDFQIGLFLLGVIGIFFSSVSGKTVGKGRENFVTRLCIGLRLFACIPLFLHSRILRRMPSVCWCAFGFNGFSPVESKLGILNWCHRTFAYSCDIWLFIFKCSTWFIDGGLRMTTRALNGWCCQYFGICHRDFTDWSLWFFTSTHYLIIQNVLWSRIIYSDFPKRWVIH